MSVRFSIEIIPIDIRRIRQGLCLTQKGMGERLGRYLHEPRNHVIPGSRINEWEMRVRPIPDYVFMAYTELLMDVWAKVQLSDHDQGDLDTKFAALISPALAAALQFENELKSRRDEEGFRLLLKAEHVRIQIQRHLESLLRVDLTHILPTR